MHNFSVGDRVRVVKPTKTKAKGPDCVIGNVLTIIRIDHSDDDSLILDCHPYSDGRCLYVSANPDRFEFYR